MHCPSCQYPLWNLGTRTCPECGRGFRVEEFEFAPNSVRYRCPGCSQAYYGTTQRGHLFPPEFDCVQCGRHTHMNEMVLEPADGTTSASTIGDRVSWHASDMGWTRRFISTVGQALTAPNSLGRGIRNDDRIGPAIAFAALNATVTGILVALPSVLCMGLLMPMTPGGGNGPAIAGMLALSMGAWIIGMPVYVLIAGLILGSIAHGVLRVTGETNGTLGRTITSVYYSSGANMVSAIPCVGSYFAWIWWLVSAILTVKESQVVSGGRASLALVPPPVLLVLALVGGYTALVVTAINTAGGIGGMYGDVGEYEADAAASAIISAAGADGVFEGHIAQCLIDGTLAPEDLISPITDTWVDTVPMEQTTLEAFMDTATAREQQAMADYEARQLPADTIAYRFGDMVFTHHGVDLADDIDAWIVIIYPENGAAQWMDAAGATVVVAEADGDVLSFAVSAFGNALQEQNQYRFDRGLGMIPSPPLVYHQHPVRAGEPE